MISPPNKILIIMLITFFVVGVFEYALSTDGQPLNEVAVVHAILTSVLSFFWCKSHIRYSNIAGPPGSAALAGFIAPFGVPIYLFRAFGFKQGSVKTAKALVFFVLLILVYLAGMYVGDRV